MPLADLMNLRFCRHVHTSRYARFSSSFCPVQAPEPECHPYAVCGSPSRSGKGPHPAGPLTGNMHPPSWRAEPGSDPRPDGQRFRTGDTAAGVRSIWPLTRGPADPARRYPDRWDVMAQVLQRYSHIGCRPFHPDRADHFQGAGDQFQLLHADFTEVRHTAAAFRTAGFRRIQPMYLAGKVCR